MLRPLLEHLEDETSLTVGTDLHLQAYPLDSTSGVMLQEYGGNEDVRVSDRFIQTVRVISRDDSNLTAHANLMEVHDEFRVRGEITLPSISGYEVYKISTVSVASRPQRVGLDDNGRHVYQSTYVLHCQRTA